LITLLTTSNSLGCIATQTGFKDQRQMKTMFNDIFMININTLERPTKTAEAYPRESALFELPSYIVRQL